MWAGKGWSMATSPALQFSNIDKKAGTLVRLWRNYKPFLSKPQISLLGGP
jgi:hypothetical protein